MIYPIKNLCMLGNLSKPFSILGTICTIQRVQNVNSSKNVNIKDYRY